MREPRDLQAVLFAALLVAWPCDRAIRAQEPGGDRPEAPATRQLDVEAAGEIVRRGFTADGASLSPFSGLRQAAAVGGGLEVQLPGAEDWFGLEAVDRIETGQLVAVCKRAFGKRWWKRINEDLPEVLQLLGHDGSTRVDLRVRDLDTDRVELRPAVVMTRDNRQALKRALEGRALVAVDRPSALPATVWEADVADLRQLLEQHFSYATMRGIDPAAATAELTKRLRALAGERGSVSRDRFAIEVQRTVAAFGDGHAGVRGLSGFLGPTWLPFLVEQSEAGLVAIRPDRSGFVDAEHPFVLELDGQPVDHWLRLRAGLETAGSQQLICRRSVRGLRAFPALRRLDGRAATDSVVVTLADADGKRVRRQLPLTTRRPIYGTWPRGADSRWLNDEIGYLRIESMDDEPEFLDRIDRSMRRFQEARGLIVDVRGNGGGTRDSLRRLLPWLLSESEPAVVVNVAAARVPATVDPADATGFLANRFLYPAAFPGHSTAARRAIEAVAEGFEPSWQLPERGFSGWHYFVIERGERSQVRFTAPVVVLMDHDCFSATDVFLGALKGRPGVTLVGTPSGGGSARSRTRTLAGSGLQVRLGSMASFRPDGRAYDGVGVLPDVQVEPAAVDFLRGGGDRQLEKARSILLDE